MKLAVGDLRAVRLEILGVSQELIGRMAGVSGAAIGRAERGTLRLSPETAGAVERAVGRLLRARAAALAVMGEASK